MFFRRHFSFLIRQIQSNHPTFIRTDADFLSGLRFARTWSACEHPIKSPYCRWVKIRRLPSAEDNGFTDAGNRRIRGVLQRRNHTSKQIRTCNPLIVMIKKIFTAELPDISTHLSLKISLPTTGTALKIYIK